MKVLVLNSGSSSIKYQLFDTDKQSALARGIAERIGLRGAMLSQTDEKGERATLAGEIIDHQQAIQYIIALLIDPDRGVIKDIQEVDAIGHRVVHGGEKFSKSAAVNDEILNELRACVDLAPLHNPHNIKGIEACRSLLPGKPNVAVFDTAFHLTMPKSAYIYGIPYILYKRHGVRRYGFHGTSHYYVSRRARDLMEVDIEDVNMITCHLGNGSSITAIQGGKSIDTSMGFTPTEGLIMGTRSGDVDTAAMLHVMRREDLDSREATTLLNKHSGLVGISGISSDMRELESEAADGNTRALLAIDVMTYRLKKYIAAYTGALGKVDALIFTGGIGENSSLVREKALVGLDNLGFKLDTAANEKGEPERLISAADSPSKIYTIPTNEELVIAFDTERVVNGEL
ncbi:MAG: acetate kinase [Candidatus Marinimicrobia bacterium]|nr:acetate kinase [Candidatus Neomarinimicrobiota bacterium]MCF7839495.1 acetate kinase [Candidatus Neomarinimicrobiota bacterium]MCF7902027.1 acetate kinase [Candidatus Neomarinimicrobiota bacterium]